MDADGEEKPRVHSSKSRSVSVARRTSKSKGGSQGRVGEDARAEAGGQGAEDEQAAKTGEADRVIITKMPKHLFSGKRQRVGDQRIRKTTETTQQRVYRSVFTPAEAEMAVSFEVPTIDISAFDGDDPVASAAVVDAVRTACENVGSSCSPTAVATRIDRDAPPRRGFFDLAG